MSARHPASQHAKPLVQWETRVVRTQNKENCYQQGSGGVKSAASLYVGGQKECIAEAETWG